jgi:hypothetical protein
VHSSSESSRPRKAYSNFPVQTYNIRSEVLTAIMAMIPAVWDVTPHRTISNYQHLKADDMLQHARRPDTPSVLL